MMPEFIRNLFKPKIEDKPDDLRLFDEARARLHLSSKALAKEADAFGEMLRGMRGVRKKPPRNCSRKRKKK